MTKMRPCEAKDPSSCRYHGTKIAQDQWLPQHAVAVEQLSQLNNAVMTASGRTRLQQLETARAAAILDVDASVEGFTALGEQAENARGAGERAYWVEEKMRAALAHRHNRLTQVAVNDFENMRDEEYTPSTVERLFSGTEAIAFTQGGTTVVSSGSTVNGKVEFNEYDLQKPEDRAALITLRQHVGNVAAAWELYNRADTISEAADMPGQRVVAPTDATYAVVYKDEVPYLRVEFNQDGTFREGIVAGATGGNSRFLPSSTTVRSHMAQVAAGKITVQPILAYLAA